MFRHCIRLIYFVFAAFVLNLNGFAGDTIVVENNFYGIDQQKKLIVVNKSVDILNSEYPNVKTVIQLDEYYDFSEAINQVTVGTLYTVENSAGDLFDLYLTGLPLIFINTYGVPIAYEGKILASFILSHSNMVEINENIGIEIRGGSSQWWPKNSYLIEFWNDATGDEKLDVSLLNMRTDDDWNLQALYNEPLRMRSVTCFKLWQQIHTLYYSALEPDAQSGADMEYAELFLNGKYWGIYAVGERVDRKQLKLKKNNGDEINGELYKAYQWGSANTFSELESYDNSSEIWSGYEYEYPEDFVEWLPLYQFVDFVINSSNETFYSQYKTKFDINSAVDYYIFMNLSRALDNTGKNIYIAKYNSQEPYFYVPWDLDATFGIFYDGSHANATNDIQSNGFYDRMIHDCSANGFWDLLQSRWAELRTSIITTENIMSLFDENYNLLLSNGVYSRESMRWDNFPYDAAEYNYLASWIDARLSFLDEKFAEPCVPQSVEYVTIAHAIRVYPNPCSTDIFVHCDIIQYPALISIYNTKGQIVVQQNLVFDDTNINVSCLRSGMYYIQLSNAEKLVTGKFIKKD